MKIILVVFLTVAGWLTTASCHVSAQGITDVQIPPAGRILPFSYPVRGTVVYVAPDGYNFVPCVEVQPESPSAANFGISVVPEPSTWALLVGGGALILSFRRKWKV
jgi:hypothetical protein